MASMAHVFYTLGVTNGKKELPQGAYNGANFDQRKGRGQNKEDHCQQLQDLASLSLLTCKSACAISLMADS